MAREEAEALAKELHLDSYRETSALAHTGLKDCMDAAVSGATTFLFLLGTLGMEVFRF